MNRTDKQRQLPALRILAASILLLATTPSQASPALDFSLNGAHLENQSVTGTIGWEFSVNQPITVTHIGLFDQGQDGLAELHTIGVWSITGGGPLFQATIPAGNATLLDGKFRYVPTADVTLQPGNYVIAAQYLGGSPDARVSDATEITTDPSIAYVGGRFGVGSNLPFPSTPSGSGHYFGPNFQLVPVPEPSTLALFGLGGLALGIQLRRRMGRTIQHEEQN